MRNRPDHREAVARRLDLLRAELEPDPTSTVDDEPWWETAPVLELVPPAVDDDPRPPPVPVPGRHAARRSVSPTSALRERASAVVPERLRSGGVGPWHLTLLALLIAAALAVTCWWLLRGDPKVTPVTGGPATPLVTVSSGPSARSVPAAAGSGAADAAGASATVTVDVAGKVRHPGVLDLPTGSRVVDAIAAAGGARRGADLSSLNRARVLVDGEQLVVGAPGGRAASGTAGAAGSTSASGSTTGPPDVLVDLNTAGLDELDTLPGVGPVTAQAILDYRTQHGGFGSVDELLDVDGIGKATLSKITPHV